jgi:hypothetical protein
MALLYRVGLVPDYLVVVAAKLGAVHVPFDLANFRLSPEALVVAAAAFAAAAAVVSADDSADPLVVRHD